MIDLMDVPGLFPCGLDNLVSTLVAKPPNKIFDGSLIKIFEQDFVSDVLKLEFLEVPPTDTCLGVTASSDVCLVAEETSGLTHGVSCCSNSLVLDAAGHLFECFAKLVVTVSSCNEDVVELIHVESFVVFDRPSDLTTSHCVRQHSASVEELLTDVSDFIRLCVEHPTDWRCLMQSFERLGEDTSLHDVPGFDRCRTDRTVADELKCVFTAFDDRLYDNAFANGVPHSSHSHAYPIVSMEGELRMIDV